MSDSLHIFFGFFGPDSLKKNHVQTLGSYFLILPIKLSQHKTNTYKNNSFASLKVQIQGIWK